MELLEREAPLAQLIDAARRVRENSRGACALVYGEAGIGKTALVQACIKQLDAAQTRLLLAGCEALYTPRPLGPLVDLAAHFEPSIAVALRSGTGGVGMFAQLLDELRDSGRPTVLVIEDMHWADAATLDFVRYCARRAHHMALLLVLTYRSDELAADHPLRRVIGELPAAITMRTALQRLSADAVARLAARGARSARQVYEATGGNPFYVTEVLSTAGSGVPPSVSDAVLARLAGLSGNAREVTERVSLFPNQVEATLLHALAPTAPEALDECLQQGLLVARGNAIAFRHELAREAVQQSISAPRRAALHGAVFAALRAAADDGELLARQVHHAAGAGLDAEVLKLAPRAARQAAASGAHRESARLYALALRHAQMLAPADRAALLEARAQVCASASLLGEAVRARGEALALHRQLGNCRAVGVNLRWLAFLSIWCDGMPKAYEYARQAIETLETLPPDAELALAYRAHAHLHLVNDQPDEARVWAGKALALAESVGDAAALSQALDTQATVSLRMAEPPEGWAMLQRSLDLALANGLEQEASIAYNNFLAMSLVHRRYAAAVEHADRGIAYCEARGVDTFTVRMRIRRAYAHLQRGHWHGAAADLAEVREHHWPAPMEQAARDFVQGLLDLRRGAAGADDRLEHAAATMRRLDVRIWFTSVAAARAETAWLRGDAPAVQHLAAPEFEQALSIGDAWGAGELAAWLFRAGHAVAAPPSALATPYALEVSGRAREAAQAWQCIGDTYQRALVLAGGDEAELREALQLSETLGTTPLAELIRRRLRARGARGVQRGPQPRTRNDPLGLTAREREVFERLLRGLSNAEIAQRLHRSGRTVEHHVAAVFNKLGVGSRAELMAGFRAGHRS
jgi:DNA-binding CsgD family transcriptional regulator